MAMTMGIRRPDFNWEAMSKWWSAHSDGTHSPVSGEDQENFMESMEESMKDARACIYDVVDRVHQIAFYFLDDTEDVDRNYEMRVKFLTSAQFEASLDELLEHAEYVDIAEALHEVNGLASLFNKVLCYKYAAGVYNKYAAVRAKAAEVVTAMVHNNFRSQQLVMEVNGLQRLLDNFISDRDVTARTKALGAISSLIWNNKPGITAFLLDNGYAALRDALRSESVKLQKDALNLIQYLLHENSSDCNIVTVLGLPHIMMHLASNDDVEVREAALRCLLVLARVEESENSGRLVKNDDKLKQVLQERLEGINAMAMEGLGVAKEEIQLVDSLWNACYNEPSSLGEKGLLVLPGC